MSHASLLVVTRTHPLLDALTEILLPYHEYETTGIERYVEWVDETEAFTRSFNEEKCQFVRLRDGTLVDYHDERFYERTPPSRENGWSSSRRFGEPPGAEVVELPRAGAGRDLHAEAEREGYLAIPDHPGRFGRRTNPNARWDWWQVGGRYAGRLRARPGVDTTAHLRYAPNYRSSAEVIQPPEALDQCRVGDLDRPATAAASRARYLGWWDEDEERFRVARAALSEDEMFSVPAVLGGAIRELDAAAPDTPRREMLRRVVPLFGVADEHVYSREAYGERGAQRALFAFALLDEEGSWHERGNLGWWASVADPDAEWPGKLAERLAALPDDRWLTVVDYHI